MDDLSRPTAQATPPSVPRASSAWPVARPGGRELCSTEQAARAQRWPVRAGGIAMVCLALVAASCKSSGDPVLDEQATKGKQVALDKGCFNCHSPNGNKSEGPTWKGLYGKTETLTNGQTVTVDDAFITSSIKTPDAQKAAGYNSTMPTIPLSDDQIAAVIAYLKALK